MTAAVSPRSSHPTIVREYKREPKRRQGRVESGRVSGQGRQRWVMRQNLCGPPPAQKRSRKTINWRIGVYEKLRKSALRRRGPLGDECQLQVGDFPIPGGMPREEGDDAHRPSAAGAGQGVDLVNLADNGRPALGGDAPQLLLDNAQRESRKASLADLDN